MKKYNLPVILLKGLILLPHNSLKLEFDSKNVDNNVIDYSKEYAPKHTVKVIKKDGSTEEFNVQKVISAVGKSAHRHM